MMPKFGQIFYGRGKDGYGILGASPLGQPFSDSVTALCRAVGSPDRPGDVRPFLISKCERGHVIMIRACRDEDPSGRTTLFFHVLVAKEEELASVGLDAFVLAERSVFVSSLPGGSINDVPFPSSVSRSVNPCSTDVRLPAFIAADHPLDAEVRRFLGRETLSRNWATYSYNPLQGFDLCVYSSYGASPTNGNRYAFVDGRFIAASGTRSTSPTPQSPAHVKDRSLMLKVSLVLNAVLVVVLVAAIVLRNGNGKDGHPTSSAQQTPASPPNSTDTELASEMTKEEAFQKWGAEWQSEFRQKLHKSFEKRLDDNLRISDFVGTMARISPAFKDYPKEKWKPQMRTTYERLEAYVSFVEEEIVKQQPQSKERSNHEY